YQRSESQDLVRLKKTPQALDAVLEKVKGDSDALAQIVGKLRLPPNAKAADLVAAVATLTKEAESKKAAGQSLQAIAKALKEAGNDELGPLAAVKKIIADKKAADDKLKVADDKLKGVAAALDKAGAADADVGVGLKKVIDARDGSEAIV